jgi:hypothetical protein
MCLHRLYHYPCEESVGYKIMALLPNGDLLTPWGKTIHHLGQVAYAAPGEHIWGLRDSLRTNDGNEYPIGFHVYTDPESAKRRYPWVWKNGRTIPQEARLVLVRVWIRGVLAHGQDQSFGGYCVVARECYFQAIIHRDIWRVER